VLHLYASLSLWWGDSTTWSTWMDLVATIQERIGKNGQKSYRVLIRVKGVAPISKTFHRLTDAKRWAAKTEADLRSGDISPVAQGLRRTVAEAIDRYLVDCLPRRQKNTQTTASQLEWWKWELGSLSIAHLTPSVVSECRDRLLNTPTVRGQRSEATVNRYLAAFSCVLNVASKEWGWINESPMGGVRRLREPRGRVRFLEKDELDSLLRACLESSNRFLHTIVLLAVSTGMRKGEMLGLRWRDIELESGWAILHDTKNGERRRVTLRGVALSSLRSLCRSEGDAGSLVFSAPYGDKPINFRASWDAVLKKAGIDDFRFHDLRHCAASYLVMSGASTAEVAEILGHKTLQMVKRYAHLSESHISGVVERMNQAYLGEKNE